MAANNILSFAQDAAANVLTQAAYAADSQRVIGHQPGIARGNLANKNLRQVTALAVGLAQFIADNQATDVNDDLLAAALSTMISDAVRKVAMSPAGTIVWVPGTSALPNTLKLNGALVSRTTYSKLWTYAQGSGNIAASDGTWQKGQFSPGDGSTTFRLLDMRGYHLRAWDDGAGVDPGRSIGSVQNDQNQSHAHPVSDPGHGHPVNMNDPGHVHTQTIQTAPEAGVGNPWGSGGAGNDGPYVFTTAAAATGISVAVVGNTTGISIGVSGGSETRVKTIALMPLIYF